MLAAIAGLLIASPAAATELYCTSTGAVNWNLGTPHTILAEDDDHGFDGWFEFWVDTANGEWRGRTIGSAALYTDGGTFKVANDGTGYRDHWVGIDAEGGRESLHIMLTREPPTFIRVTRDGFADVGSCLEPDGRTFIDGREVVQ